MRDKVTRLDAELEGALLYNIGVPCIRGHTVGKYVSSGQCLACHTQLRRERRLKRLEARKQRNSRE